MTITAPTDELENGSRSTTPAGDNLLSDFARAEADAYGCLVRAAGGRVEHHDELGLLMTDAASPCPFGNVAHLSRPLAAAEATELVDAMRTFYGGTDGGRYLLFSTYPTPDLAPLGLVLGGHPPMMVRPPAPATAPPAPTTTRFRIEVVRDSAQLEDFERTMVEAYPTDELAPFGSQPRLFREPLLESAWTLYVGYEGDRPVATSSAFVTDQVVAVEMVSTRRVRATGRGYGAAITAVAAATRDDRPSALVSSDLGNAVYRRIGYLPILRYTLWMGRRAT